MEPGFKLQMRELLKIDPERALDSLNAYIRMGNPDDAETHYLFGLGNYRLARFQAAQAQFWHVVALDKNNAEGHFFLGLCLEEEGKMAEAMTFFQKAAHIDPKYVSKLKAKVDQYGTSPPSEKNVSDSSGQKLASLPSSLVLPDTEPAFKAYEARTRRKAEIDRRADFDAIPNWAKALFWAVGIAVVGLIISILVGQFGPGGFQGQQNETHQEYCDSAKKKGVDLPGC